MPFSQHSPHAHHPMDDLFIQRPELPPGAAETPEGLPDIPEHAPTPWGVAFIVSWRSVRRRFFRSLITMTGVILAIAFLTYMRSTAAIVHSLIVADVDELNVLLQKSGVDILAAGKTDSRMILLITLSLLTCLVGIINAMLMSVTERIKEIGTMKCLGARDEFILKTYFIEAVLQGVLGTAIGMALGLLIAVVVARQTYHGYVSMYMPARAVAGVLLVSILVGSLISILAAIAPARWAARKQPVDAMRVEE